VVGYAGYQVSNTGRMRSYRPSGGWHPQMRTVPIILAPGVNPKGYVVHNLCVSGKHTTRHLHLMAMEAFGPPKPLGTECSHVDGNKRNCAISNLKWETHQANMDRKFIHVTAPVGVANPRAKLTYEKVEEIRRRRKDGETLSSLAKAFSVSIPTIWGITVGRFWKYPPADD